jgi:phosphopantetheinyl transferase
VLKESLGKALGCGLNESILRREFDLTGTKPTLKDKPELFFQEFSLPNYRCAVCSQTANIFGLIEVVL